MRVLVAGAGGALGGHLVGRLLADGHEVRAVDIKSSEDWWQLHDEASLWDHVDLMERDLCAQAVKGRDWVFNLAADMGGMGFISTHRADCMMSVLINTHLIAEAANASVSRYWYASSACIYPEYKQNDPSLGYRLLKEEDAYPADAEPGYGWEKLFSELMCQYVSQDWNLPVRIARLHNVYGPHSTWQGGREKAPAALCRKVAIAKYKGDTEIDIWGDGTATRSFLYVDDFVEGALRIMESDCEEPINLGSEEVVTVNQLSELVQDIAGVKLKHRYQLLAPTGVAGRGSDNTMLEKVTGWTPPTSLRQGLEKLYEWVESEVLKEAQ